MPNYTIQVKRIVWEFAEVDVQANSLDEAKAEVLADLKDDESIFDWQYDGHETGEIIDD